MLDCEDGIDEVRWERLMAELPRRRRRRPMIEILEKIRALPEVSAFQIGFVKGEAEGEQDVYEWDAVLSGHHYKGTIGVRDDNGAEGLAFLLPAALESLEKGIADAKRFSEVE